MLALRCARALRPAARRLSDAGGGLSLSFAAPHTVFYFEAAVQSVTLPGVSGVYGVTAGHSPLAEQLQPGVVAITHKAGEDPEKFFVSGGFAFTDYEKTEVSALEAWPDVMHHAMDADGNEMYIHPWRVDTNPNSWPNSDDWAHSAEGRAPAGEVPTDIHVTSNIEAGVFFVLWIIFGCFVVVNMTVGVVVDTFSKIKAETDGSAMLTAGQAPS